MIKTIIIFKDNIKDFVKSNLSTENVFVACKAKDIGKIDWETLSCVKCDTIGTIIIPDNVSFIEFCIKNLGANIEKDPDTGIFDEGKLITKEGTGKKIYSAITEPKPEDDIPEPSDAEIKDLFEEEETKELAQDLLPQEKNPEEENPFELNQAKDSIPEINIPASKIAAATESFSMGSEGTIEEPDDYVADNVESDTSEEIIGGSAIHISAESLAKAERIPVDLSKGKKKKPAAKKKETPLKPLDERLEETILKFKGRSKKEFSPLVIANIITITKNALSAEELAESIACVLDKKKISEVDRELAIKLFEERNAG